MKTAIYIDGFNLYYGCIKGTPYRWLNPAALCQLLLPNHEIVKIKYFTALVTARPNNPTQPIRQQTFLRALRTLPNLEVTLGFFLAHPVTLPLAHPMPGNNYAMVIRTDEKGSDVNLATHLLTDAFDNAYDCAVLITNDSDLLAPIQVVRQKFHKVVGVLNPQKRPARTLLANVNFYKKIRPYALAHCQFPPTLTDQHGTFHKPATW
ncbi:MAG: NYN domain-containing protein [Verrucomicrobiota bacterium]